MKNINTYILNDKDTVVSTVDNKQDIGIISLVRGSYCFYPFSIGRYITAKELTDIVQLLNTFNKKAVVVPALLKKVS